MRHISEGAYELVMGRGIANAKPVGAGKVRGIGDGERSPAKGALNHQPAGEGQQPIKGPVVKRPAKFEPRVIDGGSRYKGVSTAPLYVVPR